MTTRNRNENDKPYGVGFADGTERRFRTMREFEKWLNEQIVLTPAEESDWLWLALHNLDRGIKFTSIA